MSVNHIITFTREPRDCDMAERYCPVAKPCHICDDYFNSLPLLDRAMVEIPRRWRLLRAYGWRAFLRGMATDKEYKEYKKAQRKRK